MALCRPTVLCGLLGKHNSVSEKHHYQGPTKDDDRTKELTEEKIIKVADKSIENIQCE